MSGVAPFASSVAQADDITASQNPLRTSWDAGESTMGPAAVPKFVNRWNTALGSGVYAQPLVIGSTVIVATENDHIYGLNAGTGAIEWDVLLGTGFPISSDPTFANCTDLTGEIGVTGTPAYDSANGHIYFFANIMTGSSPEYYLVDMAPPAGGWASTTTKPTYTKTAITGSPANNSHVTFSAKYVMERPGVLILDGAVYGAFGSHCDTKPYVGFVARVSISTHQATLWSDESGVTYNQAGIWQSGGGIMSDGSGRIFLTSGNGVSPVQGAGSSPGGQLAESVIRLGVNSDGTLAAKDFFSPAAAPSWDASDTDYGSGAPVGVPFAVGAYSTLVQIGKNGQAWLLNRNSLGGREQGPGGTDNDLFATKAYGGEWGHPAIFGSTPVTIANSHTNPVDNDFLVSVGKDDVLRVFRFYVGATGNPGLTNVANSSLSFGYTSGSPVITSNGSNPASAVIWEVFTPSTKSGADSVLEAYSFGNVASNGTTPSSCSSLHMCTLTNIWHSNMFAAVKFSIPATSQGWVYVGTRDGHVLAWAAPTAVAPAVAAATMLPPVAVGSTSTRAVTVTARTTVTITGATASTSANNRQDTAASEFGVGSATVTKAGSSTPAAGSSTPAPVTFPVTLATGDKLNVRATFTPEVPGGSSGMLSLSTTSGADPTIDVPLTGEGTQEGIYAPPATLTFPWAPDWPVAIEVPVGGQKPETVTISNLGTVTQTITSVTLPKAPFSASNLPAVGTKLSPGASISVQVRYTPTSPGPATGSFTIAGSSGQNAVVNLSAIGSAAVSQLTPSTSTLNLGTIPVGKKLTAFIKVENTGNTPATLTGVGPVSGPFAAPLKPAVGLPFNPDADVLLPVTFTPARKGTFSSRYKLHWRDVTGKHVVVVTITGNAS